MTASPKMQKPSLNASGYDFVADEYYLPRHVTSRNFDAATAAYLAGNVLSVPSEGLALDLGAGRGRLGEYLRVDAERVIHVDISFRMLTLNPRERSLGRINADAQRLPFGKSTFSLVGAFLFDPFNVQDVFREVARVLRSGGVFVASLPHVVWGSMLRSAKGSSADQAVFVLQDGRRYVRRSILSDEADLKAKFASAGMLVRQMSPLTLPKTESHVSPDVEVPACALGVSPYDLPIVQLLVATKP